LKLAAQIQADFEKGGEHRTTDGYRANVYVGGYSGKLVVSAFGPGVSNIGRAKSAPDAADRAARWIDEAREAELKRLRR
jgi:hypothetical protein